MTEKTEGDTMSKGGRKGFTIVEMLMVVGVLGILIGLVTTAASTAIRQARSKRTMAMMSVLQSGLETYHAQMGKWPDALQQYSNAGIGSHKVTKVVYLDDKEADSVFQQVVYESTRAGGSPMLDVTGLMVARASSVSYSEKSNTQGIDFNLAIVNSKHRKKISRKEMAFGYTTRDTGKFRRYVIKYNFETDNATVLTQNEGSDSPNDFAIEMGQLGTALGDAEKYSRLRWPQKPTD